MYLNFEKELDPKNIKHIKFLEGNGGLASEWRGAWGFGVCRRGFRGAGWKLGRKFSDPKVHDRYLQFKIEKVRENWSFIKYPLQTLCICVILVEIFWNELVTDENVVSMAGAVFLFLSVEVLSRLVPRSDFVSRFGGIWLFTAFGIYMAEITVVYEKYKLYEGFLVLGSVEFVMSITLTVDIWI